MINIKAIQPLYTGVLLTADKYTDYERIPGSMLLDTSKIKQGLKEYQKVLAIGNMVKNVTVGDLVCIKPDRYAVKKFAKDSMKSSMNELYNETTAYNFPIVKLDNKEFLLMQDCDIDFIITDYEEIEDEKPSMIIDTPKPSIILPN